MTTRRPALFPRTWPALAVLLVALSLTGGCIPLLAAAPPTPADYCAYQSDANQDAPNPQAVHLRFWAIAPRQHCWRAFMPALAQDENPIPGVTLDVQTLNMNSEPYLEHLLQALDAGTGPDIAFAYEDHLGALIDGQKIVPLTECRQRYPSLQQIDDSYWRGLSPDGREWGVPMELEVAVLFANTAILRGLGWTQEQIANLPDAVAQGQFTLVDMAETAHQAVEAGLVAPGFGFAPRPIKHQTLAHLYLAHGGRLWDEASGRLVLDQTALTATYTLVRRLLDDESMHPSLRGASFNSWGDALLLRDAAAAGQLLFWHAYISDWRRWEMDHLSGSDELVWLHENVVPLLLPAAGPSAADAIPSTLLVDAGFYVFLQAAARDSAHMDAACGLMARTITPAYQRLHAESSGLIPVLPPEVPSDRSTVAGHLDAQLRTHLVMRPESHPDWLPYRVALVKGLVTVETGQLTPDQATAQVVDRLQHSLGERVVVE